MISRATARILGELYQKIFSGQKRNENYNSSFSHSKQYYWANSKDELYDYLYDKEYSAWFCNAAKKVKYDDKRAILEFIMKLHTGETALDATPNWTWQQREKLGQTYLFDLTKDILASFTALSKNKSVDELHSNLKRSLELDGYEYKDGKLLYSELAVLDEQEEAGILETLYKELKLDNAEITLHHLKLSSENYIVGHWGDAISNARHFLEQVLAEV